MNKTMQISKYQLKAEIRNKVKADVDLLGKIAKLCDKNWQTVYKWALRNDDMMTTTAVLKLIAAHYSYKTTDELTEKVA